MFDENIYYDKNKVFVVLMISMLFQHYLQKRQIFAGVIISGNDNNLLLGLKKTGFGRGLWNHSFVGKVERGEEIEEAARRELEEETPYLQPTEVFIPGLVYDQGFSVTVSDNLSWEQHLTNQNKILIYAHGEEEASVRIDPK